MGITPESSNNPSNPRSQPSNYNSSYYQNPIPYSNPQSNYYSANSQVNHYQNQQPYYDPSSLYLHSMPPTSSQIPMIPSDEQTTLKNKAKECEDLLRTKPLRCFLFWLFFMIYMSLRGFVISYDILSEELVNGVNWKYLISCVLGFETSFNLIYFVKVEIIAIWKLQPADAIYGHFLCKILAYNYFFSFMFVFYASDGFEEKDGQYFHIPFFIIVIYILPVWINMTGAKKVRKILEERHALVSQIEESFL